MSEPAATAQVTPQTVAPETAVPQATQAPAAPAQAGVSKAPEAPTAAPVVDATKPAEAKPEEKKADEPKKVAPEKYDLKMPDQSLLDAGAIERIASAAKERGLSNDEAQAALEKYSADAGQYIEAKKTEWLDMVTSDPELGGERLKENVELASRVIKTHGTPKLLDELNRTGYGNHPEVVRLFAKIGKMMGEDKLILPGAKNESSRLSREEIFYGKK